MLATLDVEHEGEIRAATTIDVGDHETRAPRNRA